VAPAAGRLPAWDTCDAKQLLLERHHRQLMFRAARRVRHLFTDKTTIEIVRKPRDQKGLAVIPRRWAVERTSAWLPSYRRLARDYERHPHHRRGHDPLGRYMTRRIARRYLTTRPGPRQFATT
jgi:hypothetical protein